MPCDEGESCYMPCCGKIICNGCLCCLSLHRRHVCPFCNTPAAHSEEHKKMIMERIDRFNDPEAMNLLAGHYRFGRKGFNIDYPKAVELYRRACELGCAAAHFNLGNAYFNGKGVQVDKKKAIHHYELGAMMGNMRSRCVLGYIERCDGNRYRAVRHLMIAAKCGHDASLEEVKRGFMEGLITKEDLEETFREHQASKDETKSEQRDRAREI
eukprot:scaffold147731_cov20-Cyclotella_meneghiniana.AAC.1